MDADDSDWKTAKKRRLATSVEKWAASGLVH